MPADVPEYYLAATAAGESLLYKPMVMGSAKLHFVDAKLALDQWQTTAYLAPLSDDGSDVLWSEASSIPELKSRLGKAPAPSSTFAQLPAAALRTQSYAAWGKALSAHLFESARSEVLVCDALKATSAPGMSEGDFRAQLALAAREQRDAAVADLQAQVRTEAGDDRGSAAPLGRARRARDARNSTSSSCNRRSRSVLRCSARSWDDARCPRRT